MFTVKTIINGVTHICEQPSVTIARAGVSVSTIFSCRPMTTQTLILLSGCQRSIQTRSAKMRCRKRN